MIKNIKEIALRAGEVTGSIEKGNRSLNKSLNKINKLNRETKEAAELIQKLSS